MIDKYSQKPANRNMIPRTPIVFCKLDECSSFVEFITSFISYHLENGNVLYLSPTTKEPSQIIVNVLWNLMNNIGSIDLYISFRTGTGWSIPTLLPAPINSAYLDFCPIASPDGKWLYFSSDSGTAEKVHGKARSFSEVQALLAEASDNFKAYGVPGHRHHPEITQGLTRAAGRAVNVVFVPHLAPMIRGIHATLYARLTGAADLQALYEKRYAGEAFVDVMPPGSHPDTRSVRASNVCRIAVHRPPGTDLAMVLAVEDNLVKGAAGQAIQNMNLMFGLPETAGLTAPPVLP